MLNDMYTKFDTCSEAHMVYKVETIGDAYMIASGLPEKTSEHAVEIIEMAFDMLNCI
jgi:class 3 adenylate cyclase